MKNWKIATDGVELLQADEVSCRDIFASYRDWWDNPTRAGADGLTKAANGVNPAGWSRPVELVDGSGKVISHYPPR